MNQATIDALRATRFPYPQVAYPNLYIGKREGVYVIYDITVGYLCTAPALTVLEELLEMEEQSQFSVRTLITGETPGMNVTPPRPGQKTFRGKAAFDIKAIRI